MNRLGFAYHELFKAHDAGPDHPERSERIDSILEAVKKSEWYDQIIRVEAREATPDEVALAHEPRYVTAMRRLCDAGGAFLLSMESNVGEESYPAALRAIGAGLTLADGILEGAWDVGFAPTRPPGHHASWDRPKGFCIFNSIAVLARYLIVKQHFERVAILDIDVHHGNGTESIFYNDPQIFYCSIHRDNLFPYDKGKVLHQGEGAGKGFNLNIPLKGASDDDAYFAAIDKTVIPRFREFDPQFILVSAGFDAHITDVIGGMRLTGKGYAGIAERILEIASGSAKGRIVTLMEGGYSLEGLADGVTSYLGRMIKG